MASTQSLADWNEQYGDADYTAPEQRKPRNFVHINVCYPATIRVATLVKSKRGDRQILLDMDLKDYETGEVVMRVKDWIDLPMQPTTDMDKPKETVFKLTKLRRITLSKILTAVDPKRYGLGYYKENDTDGHKVMFDWKTEEKLIGNAFTERQRQCNKETLKFAEQCHAMLDEMDQAPIEGWPGTELYFSKKENPKNERYPYSNYHSTPAYGLPMFSKSCESYDKPATQSDEPPF